MKVVIKKKKVRLFVIFGGDILGPCCQTQDKNLFPNKHLKHNMVLVENTIYNPAISSKVPLHSIIQPNLQEA